MEKSLLNESLAMSENLSDQIDCDGNERVQCSSPDRPMTESNNSPSLNESQIEGKKQTDNMNIEGNEGLSIRDAVVDVQDSVGLVHHTQINGPIILENNESAFLCKYPGCNFSTIDAELYLKHEDSHVDIGAVSCDACGMTFRTYANMRRHHLYVHQGIRTFECQYCSKRFLRKEQFIDHLAKHTKPRPYHCTFCGETFNFRGHLKTHLSTEHAGIVVGKTCHLCNFKASSPNAIKVHYATFHLKQNMDVPGSDDRVRDLCGNSHILNNPHENGAIDLAAVSQNFFMTSHYPTYLSGSENNIAMPGPSDLSCRTKVIRRASSPGPNIQNLTASVNEQNVMTSKEDDSRHTCVTSLAGSTVVSPPTCQDSACQHLELRARQRMCIKPEPPELTVDDSQNSNVQPTSTNDLSTNEVVETTCNSHETLCRRKVHKHSSSDDTSSESHNSPSNRLCVDSQPIGRTPHTCFRYRPYDESSSQRCREFSRHTCVSHVHPERRARFSDSDIERTAQNEQSDGEERKIFYSRATSTNNSLVPGDIHASRSNLATTFNAEGPTFSAAPHGVTNYFGRKNIVIRDIESCTLTCTFCGIIFPDQTLYLLHRSLHSDNNPWKCNLCGKACSDKYDFNSHIISKGHY